MARYFKFFKTHSEYQTYSQSGDMIKPNVSYCEDNNDVHYNPIPYDYSKDYLTFVALEDCTFTFNMNQKLTTTAVPSISYSTDNGETWTTVQNIDNEAVTVTTPTITTGNKVLWKSNAVQYNINSDPYAGSNIGHGSFLSTNAYNVEGNIMSLMYGDDFKRETAFKTPISSGYGAGAFSSLFKNNHIISVEHLELPATTLANNCYFNMFTGCSSLTTAPVLPATTLAQSCYNYMFQGCTSLTTAPVLPATTLVSNCYRSMFEGCTSLTTAPELPATTLADYCYNYMFNGCTSLTTAPVLPATTLTNNCYNDMFYNCTGLVTAPQLPATTLA